MGESIDIAAAQQIESDPAPSISVLEALAVSVDIVSVDETARCTMQGRVDFDD